MPGSRSGLFKDGKENLTGDDVREGLVAVISVKLSQPQFEGQTNGKREIPTLRELCRRFIRRALGAVFEQNAPVARKIINKAVDVGHGGARRRGRRGI